MIVISNSSPLIALSRIQSLNILKKLFGHICISDAVYEETVVECPITAYRDDISGAVNDFIDVISPAKHHTFSRNLGKGERGTLSLALEKNPDILLLDDKKARNEANELGLTPFFTTDILRWAEAQKIIYSYEDVLQKMQGVGVYLGVPGTPYLIHFPDIKMRSDKAI